MNSLPDINPIPSDLSDRTLTFNLTLNEDSTVSIRSCEVLGRAFRNRVSFSSNRTIDDVLVPRLSHAITSCLRTLPDGAHVLSLPDFLVELPGLVLSGVHVMVLEAKDGLRNAILRFKEFMGTINSAFHQDIGFHEPYSNHSEKLAVNVLAEVCLPILNLCRSFEELNFGTDRQRALEISDRAREFEFQTELLKRFIFNAGLGHAEAATAYLHSETSPQIRRLTS
ncbi:MAG: hypothetical protein AAF999_04365 [Pseudomonadota bacterium]